jgi:ketosteroid isomerase-like protein
MPQSTVTASENVEAVRRGYAAFNTADVDTLIQVLDENATWKTPGRGFLAGTAVGRDAVLAQFGRYGGETNGTFRAELRFLTSDDEGRVIAMHRNTGERNGKKLDVDCLIVFELTDGRVVSGTEYFNNLYAWDAFWS